MKKFIYLAAILLGTALIPGKLYSKVVPETIFTDNMVLQRNTTAKIWGSATPFSKVTLSPSWDRKSYTAKAGADGKWEISFPTPDAGGPYTIKISDGKAITLSNILIGEVWLCGGQSNMEMPMASTWAKDRIGVDGLEEELANTGRMSGIRLLNVQKASSLSPESSAAVTNGGWTECAPETLKPFSATAYFFGKYIYEALGIPVGLIESCWGGSLAEAWTGKDNLRQMSFFDEKYATEESVSDMAGLERKIRLSDEERAAMEARWLKTVDAEDPSWRGGTMNWAAPDLNDLSWKNIKNPCIAETVLGSRFDGAVWFRKTVEIPAEWEGRDLDLGLSIIDDMDWTFFNGVRVGSTDGFMTPRNYTVPGALVKAGKAVIAVRMVDTKGTGGIWGKPEEMFLRPGGGGGEIPLAGIWKYKISVPKENTPPWPPVDDYAWNYPSVLYNAMIYPLAGYAIRGAIWYQGESNADRATQYKELLPLMIEDWRQAWGYEFPFYIVQIANFKALQTGPEESDWAYLREAQTFTARHVAGSGLAVAIDIGEALDIHPRNKAEVGRRLALQALGKTYGKDLVCDGPLYRDYRIEGSCVVISFDSAEGLTTSDGLAPEGFWIAGPDHIFTKAEAKISGDKVIVSAPGVKFPVAVRYAWANNPVCNLVNGAGLPASPFRTDTWPEL